MAATVDIRPMPGYLHATVSGDYGVEATKDAITRILAAAHAHPTSKILIDCSGYRGCPTLGERFQVVGHVLQLRITSMLHGQPGRYQTAVVGSPPLVHPAAYGVRLLAERSLKVAICATLEDALDWLGVTAEPATSPSHEA